MHALLSTHPMLAGVMHSRHSRKPNVVPHPQPAARMRCLSCFCGRRPGLQLNSPVPNPYRASRAVQPQQSAATNQHNPAHKLAKLLVEFSASCATDRATLDNISMVVVLFGGAALVNEPGAAIPMLGEAQWHPQLTKAASACEGGGWEPVCGDSKHGGTHSVSRLVYDGSRGEGGGGVEASEDAGESEMMGLRSPSAQHRE